MIALSQRAALSLSGIVTGQLVLRRSFRSLRDRDLGCELVLLLRRRRSPAHQLRLRGRASLRAHLETAAGCELADFGCLSIRQLLHAAEMKTSLSRRLGSALPISTGRWSCAGCATTSRIPRRPRLAAGVFALRLTPARASSDQVAFFRAGPCDGWFLEMRLLPQRARACRSLRDRYPMRFATGRVPCAVTSPANKIRGPPNKLLKLTAVARSELLPLPARKIRLPISCCGRSLTAVRCADREGVIDRVIVTGCLVGERWRDG